jgi:O-antigen ligase
MFTQNYLTSLDRQPSRFESISLAITIIPVFAFPIGFLSIRHSVHVVLFILFLISLTAWASNRFKFNSIKLGVDELLVCLALASLTIATIVTQVINGDFHIASLDGPSKILIAGLCIIYLSRQEINYIKILGLAIPLGLIYLLINITWQTETSLAWGGRYATKFVDPNSLGSQSAILSVICFILIDHKDLLFIKLLKLVGSFCGLFIMIQAQSRGGWLTFMMMLITWQSLQIIYPVDRFQKKSIKKILISVIAFILIILFLIILNPSIQDRIAHTLFEITAWFNDPLIYTSAGSRMSMWIASIQLIGENWLGYGEVAIKETAINHPLYTGIHQHGVKDLINSGPHSDILSKGLSLGLPGIMAYLATIFIPFMFFLKNIASPQATNRKAVLIGLVYTTGVFVSGLFNETLSLKYLCSFYGLMIACLVSQVLFEKSNNKQSELTA